MQRFQPRNVSPNYSLRQSWCIRNDECDFESNYVQGAVRGKKWALFVCPLHARTCVPMQMWCWLVAFHVSCPMPLFMYHAIKNVFPRKTLQMFMYLHTGMYFEEPACSACATCRFPLLFSRFPHRHLFQLANVLYIHARCYLRTNVSNAYKYVSYHILQ